MKKSRVYIDTSVMGGCFDEEFKIWSIKLFNEFHTGAKTAVVPQLTIDELREAPLFVKAKLGEIPDSQIEIVENNDEIDFLAGEYIKNKAVPEKYFDDATHIAYATFYKVDFLVSWNFKHIVNINRIRKYNSVNLSLGYQIIEIRSPREVLNETDE